MKIKFRTQIRSKVVNMLVETGDFTDEENEVLNQVGEPIIKIDKMYDSNSVKIEKKVRSGFRVSLKFDGNLSETMDDVMVLIGEFKADLELIVTEAMGEAALSFSEQLNKEEEEGDEIEIKTNIPTF